MRGGRSGPVLGAPAATRDPDRTSTVGGRPRPGPRRRSRRTGPVVVDRDTGARDAEPDPGPDRDARRAPSRAGRSPRVTDRWTWPAYVGLLGGALLFAAFLVPALAWQYRRYGRLSGRRLVGAAAVAVYGVALVAYTLLPLPSGDLARWCAQYGVAGAELVPFHSLADVRRDTAGLGLGATLRSTAVLQVVFNVVLFVPWGVLVRRYLGRGVLVTTLSGLLVSLLVETTQYTGIFGIIPCSYRVADVDDVLTNTLGALLGALAAPLLLRWMPRAGELEARREEARPVTVWRRWLGMLLDALLVTALGVVLQVAYRTVLYALGRPLPDGADWAQWLLGTLVPFAVVFVVPTFLGSGASWGQRTVWLAPRWAGRRGTMAQRVARAAAGGALWGALGLLSDLPAGVPAAVGVAASVAAPLAALFAVVSVVAVPFTRGRRGLSGAVSGAELVDAREVPVSPR
ncbi:VanZ family protein [Sphaerisporangium cinnabarinum]|nr:VanZ family protein [Sphaerisporangium cinnabarinum]